MAITTPLILSQSGKMLQGATSLPKASRSSARAGQRPTLPAEGTSELKASGPDGWTKTHLKDILAEPIKDGHSPVAAEKETGFWVLGLGALSDNGINVSHIKPVEPTEKVLQSLLRPGDFLVSRSNTPDKVGRSILFKGELDNCSYPNLMMRFRIDERKADPGFIEHKLKSPAVRAYFKNCAAGTCITMVKINKTILEKTPLFLPELSEQRKVAQILSAWDKAITAIEQLLANNRQQKKALTRQLLTGSKRFPGFSSQWVKKPISSFIRESRVQGSTGDKAQKLTVKLYGRGVVSKHEKRTGSASTKYYKRSAGQFIYSKLDFLNGAFGVIPPELDGYESTLDLPAFDFLSGVNATWLVYYISREEFYLSNPGLANGGRKARRVNPKDFLDIKIPTPSNEEQQKIASVLAATDRNAETLEQKLACLKQEKQVLMKYLLTGKRRIKVSSK